MRAAAPTLALLLAACAPARWSEVPRADGRVVMRVGEAELAVRYGPPVGVLTRPVLEAWVERAARMVADYCGGRFPVSTLEVDVVTRRGGSLGWGQHWGGARVMAVAGGRATRRGLERDWVLVHEMLHLAFPRLPRRQRWMREGLSTYLETVVRARAGVYTEREVWTRWARQMPLGLPRPGDRGFDRTPSWASTYWGGALFWLRVDVELRRRTAGRVTLRALIRGLLARGGDATARWSVRRLLREAREVTGTDVVGDLYQAMARRPGRVDLDALFAALGVVRTAEGVRFDDAAPLAATRRAMSARSDLALPPIPAP